MTQPSTQKPAGSPPMPDVTGVTVEHEYHDLPTGVRMHVARAGDPSLPAIVLVHGWPQHWWLWRGVIGELAAEAHLIMPDLRGHGWSSTPTGLRAATKGALATDLVHLLDALGIDDVAIVGHDWGGWTSQMLALDHPSRVRRLLTFSIPSIVPTPRPPIRKLLKLSYQLPLSAPFSNKVIARKRGEAIAKGMRSDVRQKANYPREDTAVFSEQFGDPVRAKFAQSMYRSFVLGDALSIMRRYAKGRFQMPVRFVLSRHDAYIPTEFAKVERTGAQVDAVLHDTTGHFVVDEDPAFVAEQIRTWVLPHATPLAS